MAGAPRERVLGEHRDQKGECFGTPSFVIKTFDFTHTLWYGRCVKYLYIFMKTMTKTKVSTKAVVAVAVLLVAGGAAYAATAMTNMFGYRMFEATCYDGSQISDDGQATKMRIGGQTYLAPSSGCQSAATWKSQAHGFCSYRPAGPNGKRGVNSFGVTDRCRIQPGVIYGYGHNRVVTTTLQQPTGINLLRQQKNAPGLQKPY